LTLSSVRKTVSIGLSVVVVLFAFALIVSSANATIAPLRPIVYEVIQDSTSVDSLSTKNDSLRPKKYEIKDSTYLEQLTFRRKDSDAAQAFPAPYNPFYLKTPTLVVNTVQLDSTGKFVIVRQTVNGKDIKLPIKMPINEYVQQRATSDFEKNFTELIDKEESVKASKKRDDIGDLLGTFTKIDIPVPANPVFSIFGPPRINLNISGAVDIRAAFRNTSTDQQTLSAFGNTRNEPDFAQEVQINVSGTIGDKLNILADWNTQRTFEYENQLKIKYTGYEDEIVQSVEAGNVSLSTSSSFVSSSSALFGIKAAFQIGPLKLTAIASQKKGQIQEKSISGGAQKIDFEKRAWEYSKDHFFVDTVYRALFEPFIKTRQANGRLQIKENEYEVWLYHIGAANETMRKGNAYFNLPDVSVNDTITYKSYRSPDTTTNTDAGLVAATWDRLEPQKDYRIERNAGYITLNRSVQEGQAIAISYRIENFEGNDDDRIYGTLTKNETGSDSILVLKLVKPLNYTLPKDSIPFSLMLKNIYPLGGRKVDKEGFSLDLKYKESGKDPVDVIGTTKIITLFGLDLVGDGSNVPDGKFDFNPGVTIDQERGEIIFPTLKPFTDGLEKALRALPTPPEDSIIQKYLYNDLYDTTSAAAQQNTLKDRFVITGQITASSSNTVNLGFNVVEGSVQVLLNGQPLVANVDYTVDYIIGQVIIKKQEALVPGASLQVKFEQNDLFQLASKTLMGLRGEVDVSEKTKFGFTMMNLDQQVLSDKVRLNEEPSNNSIYGFDGQTSGEIPYLTKMIDALPFLDTKAKSEFTLRGEAAYMNPDPNTKKSSIADDQGNGIAYIDDFEGAKRIIPLGVGYGQWHEMSAPAFQFGVDRYDTTAWSRDTTKLKSKARTFWYNPIGGIPLDAIYGIDANGKSIKQAGRGQDLIQVLNVNYNPLARGVYNYSPDLQQTLLNEPKKNWGGIQKLLSTSAINLISENVGFIEIWVRVNPNKGRIDSTRKIYIDLGTISEDIYWDKSSTLNTEDKGQFKNDILAQDEDTGIDGLFNNEEQSEYKTFVDANKALFPDIVNDPSGDDFEYSTTVFNRINQTEHNSTSEIGRFPDSEDLNRNSYTDRTNDYYEYELNLDTTDANPLKIGGGTNGWFQYRIPINSYKYKIGTPDQSNIQYARLWFTGHPDEFDMQFVEFNLIGNQWEEVKKNDPVFKVSVVNVEDNSLQGYVSPPGVFRERDRTKPDEQVYGNEQSLALNILDLSDGDSREAIKKFSYRPLDVFSYRQMKMFVHGAEHFSSTASKASVKMYIRFGSDSLNYYEYRAPVYPGWDARNNVNIRFEDLTSIKQVRDTAALRVVRPVPNGPEGSTYAVLGNPTLTRIAFISIGIENPIINGTERRVTGQIWVNELRLADVDDTPGWAYSMSTTVKLADFGSMAFNYSRVDPYFHNLESRFGSRVTNSSWNFSSSLAFERFLPQDWTGTQLGFSYSHSEAISTPQYLPSSDIVVTKAADQRKDFITEKNGSVELGEKEKQKILSEAQTLSTTDTYAVPAFKFNVPSENWFFRDLFNRVNYGFSYTTSSQRNPTTASRNSWQWNARISYAYSFLGDAYIQPFGFFENTFFFEELRELQIFYNPISSFSTGFSIARSRTNERLRSQIKDTEPIRGLASSRNFSFAWKLTDNGLINLSGDYAVDITSSMVHLELDPFGRQRNFQQIMNQMFLQDRLVNFGFDNAYNQTFTLNTRPKVPSMFDLNKYVTLSARYNVGYRWQNSLQQGDLGISTGWGNSISLSSDISLKSFVDSWFPAYEAPQEIEEPVPAPSRGRGERDDDEEEPAPKQQEEKPQPEVSVIDTTQSTNTKSKGGGGLIGIARTFIKTPFLDYDKINISFTQSNSASNGGVPGRPGFANFFGRAPFIQKGEREFGPTRSYQLGLVSVPGANITDVFIKPKFPFVGFSTDADKQIRARNANLTDGFTQNNKLTFRTGRDLWTGARIDLNWNLGWNYSRTQTLRTDSITGRAAIINIATGGSIERSFFTLPPTFVFSMFKSGIEQVGKLYKEAVPLKTSPNQDEKLAKAFEEGFESAPILKKIFGDLFPRVNYSFRWDGLEQFSLFKNFATRVSLDHAYQSSYAKVFKGSAGGGNITESQRINYAFSPLAGVSIAFKEVLKGTMSANLRYGSNVSYDLTPSSKNIVEAVGNDMSITGSFSRSGFEIPLFGVSLQNDIDISFTYSLAKNSRTTFDVKQNEFNTKGTPGEGSSRTQMEPRIRYVLSSRVTASLFYRYTKIEPDAGGSRIPGSSTNEGGVDVHIAIQ